MIKSGTHRLHFDNNRAGFFLTFLDQNAKKCGKLPIFANILIDHKS